MKKTEALIIKLDQTLQKYNKPNYNLLLPPLDESELNKYFNNLEVTNEDFISLYKWKNGFNPDQYEENKICQIMNFDVFITLEEIIYTVEAEKINNRWPPFFIPLITDFTGQYILFNNNMDNECYGRLYIYSASLLCVDPKPYYDSVPRMIETIIAAYEKEIFVFNTETNELDIDFDKHAVLCKEMNGHNEFYN